MMTTARLWLMLLTHTGEGTVPRKTRIAASFTAVAVVLAACGGNRDGSSVADSTTVDNTTPVESVQPTFQPLSAGTLMVCADMTNPPFGFRDGSRNDAGFDIDLLSAIARRYGLNATIKETPTDSIVVALTDDVCDVGASGTTVPGDPGRGVMFADSYLDGDLALLVRNDDAEALTDLETLKGKTIAVEAGSPGEKYVRENSSDAKLKTFGDAVSMFRALESRQVDATVYDLGASALRAAEPAATVKITTTFTTGRKLGFLVRNDNLALQNDINEALNIFRASGTYDEIYKRYFGNTGN